MLERRIKVLVIETTATILPKLMEQFPQLLGKSHEDTSEPESYETVAGPLAARVTVGTSDCAPLLTKGKRKFRGTPVRVKRRQIRPNSSNDRSRTQN